MWIYLLFVPEEPIKCLYNFDETIGSEESFGWWSGQRWRGCRGKKGLAFCMWLRRGKWICLAFLNWNKLCNIYRYTTGLPFFCNLSQVVWKSHELINMVLFTFFRRKGFPCATILFYLYYVIFFHFCKCFVLLQGISWICRCFVALLCWLLYNLDTQSCALGPLVMWLTDWSLL